MTLAQGGTLAGARPTLFGDPCAAVLRIGCQPAGLAKSSLSFAAGAKNSLTWKWKASAAVTDLGFPTVGSSYTLCLYDRSGGGALRLHALAPAGASWKRTSTGFTYASKSLTPVGLARVKLKAGAPGAATALVKGKGPNLLLPSTGLAPPVTVQLLHSGGAACAQATFSAPSLNLGGKFKATSD